MFLLIISFIIITIIIFIYFFKFSNKRYIKFLNLNSIALLNLLALNKKYNFYQPTNIFNESHTYDNEIFYNSISCEDYLIYQLQFKKQKVSQDIKLVNENKQKYNFYIKEIDNISNFGKYKTNANNLKTKKLLNLEKKIFKQNILYPKTKFDITISLYCAKINGRIYDKKTETFYPEQILQLIKRLNNKTGNFYNDKSIWDSLCRVERGKVSNKMRFSIYKRDHYRCQICGKSDFFDFLEIDHIKPIAKGGKSTYDNLQTLCRRCNMKKSDKY